MMTEQLDALRERHDAIRRETDRLEAFTSPQLDRRCIMCGAAEGEPCTVISAPGAGGIREAPHFYR